MTVDRKVASQLVVWSALLLLVVFAWGTMAGSKQRLDDARYQLGMCEQLAGDIRLLQNRPGFAALNVDSPKTITTRADEAGLESDLPPGALVRIEPQAAVRVRDSTYRIRPTRLELRRVTLEQVLAFSHAMIDESQGTTVRDLRLTATDLGSEDDPDVDSWTAEIVLTQLIFSPLNR